MSNRQYILAHDLGTTGNKASLFDAQGRLLSSAFAAYETIYPRPNWAEQDPDDWWHAICDTSRTLISKTGVDPATIAAIGFSGQMMGVVPIDIEGKVLRSCIIWADQRAQAEAEYMAATCGGERVYHVAGHQASPAYSAPKILWLRDHQPEIFNRSACFLQPKDYIVYRLTGITATDYSDASGTLLFDLETRRWDETFLKQLNLDATRLPALHSSTDIVGEVTAGAARATGLAAGTPVVIGGGDGSCAGAGAGVIEPGDAYCNIGSSAWISISSEQPVLDDAQRTVTFHHVHPERYAPMGTMQAAGGARQWAWDILDMPDANGTDDRRRQSLDELAASVPAGARGLLFLPYLMGERSPYWNPLARGAYIGLSMTHGRAEMARAALEGVAFNLRLILDALQAQVPPIHAMRLIGGGARSHLWRQILADALNLPIHTLALQADATSWGAAVTAGVGAGLYDWAMAGAQSQVVDVIEPIAANVAHYHELLNLYRESYAALNTINARLSGLQAST